MAQSAEGSLIGGAYTVGNIPEVYFKYDMDKLGKLIVLSRGTTAFLQFVQHKMGLKSRKVSSFEPRIQDIWESPHYIQAAVDSSTTSATNTILKVKNDWGNATIKPNDILTVDLLWYQPFKADGTANTGAEYASSFGLNGSEFYVANEQLFVTGVGENDSAGSGYTTITVRRGFTGSYGYPSYALSSIQSAPTSPPAITTDMKLFRSGNAFAHGTGYPTGTFANPYIDGNYLQEMKWAIEWVNEMELEKTFLNDSGYTPLSIATKLKAQEMMHQYEKWALFSSKGRTEDSKGNRLYTSGGFVPYIKRDSDHIIDYTRGGVANTLNYIDMNIIGDSIFALGGGQTKTAFMSHTMLTKLQNSWFGKVFLTDEEATSNFHIPVKKIELSAGSLELVATYGLREFGWNNRMLIWDFSVDSAIKTTFAGTAKLANGSEKSGDFDLYVEKNIQLPGEQVTKHGYITIGGFQQRAQQYHCIVTGFPDVVEVPQYTTKAT